MQRWRTAAAGVAAVLAGGAGVARAADLPVAVRTAASADADRSAIETYVKSQVERIASGKGAGVARDELAKQVEPNQTTTPSASFQNTYVTAVVAQLTPLINDKDVSKRLNAAIIVTRLCRSTKASQLAPLVQKLMDDASPAVAIWGINGAGALMPTVLQNKFVRDKQQLTTALVASAKKHADAGPLVQDAYNAVFLPNPEEVPLPPEAFALCANVVNELLALRTQQYLTGVPPMPQAERVAPSFFIRSAVTSAMSPAQKLTTMQRLIDLLSVAAQRLATVPGGETRTQVSEVIKNFASTVNLTLRNQKQDAVAAKFEAIARLREPEAADKQITEGIAALRALPAFKDLKDGPRIQSGG